MRQLRFKAKAMQYKSAFGKASRTANQRHVTVNSHAFSSSFDSGITTTVHTGQEVKFKNFSWNLKVK